MLPIFGDVPAFERTAAGFRNFIGRRGGGGRGAGRYYGGTKC